MPREDITGLGVGGLLMEIVTRPQPREEPVKEKGRNIAALVLGAGRSSRMGGPNKLLAEIGGRPLIRIVVDQVLKSRARPVVVVTGHQRERVEAALSGLPLKFVHNPNFADGLGTSLKAGIAALPAEVDGVIVCLGDMPQVDAGLIDRLIGALDPDKGALVAVPTIDGKRGNPVVWSRRFFPDLMTVEGDVGRPLSDRPLSRGHRRSAAHRHRRAHRRRYAGGARGGEGGVGTRLIILPAPAIYHLETLPG